MLVVIWRRVESGTTRILIVQQSGNNRRRQIKGKCLRLNLEPRRLLHHRHPYII